MRPAPALVALACACVQSAPARDYGDPAASGGVTEQAGIVASVESPRASSPATTASVDLVISAYLRARPEALDVTVTAPGAPPVRAVAQGAPGPAQRFRARVGLVHGAHALTVRIATADESHIRYLGHVLRYAGVAPGLRARAQAPEGTDPCAAPDAPAVEVTRARRACLRGEVTFAPGRTLRALSMGTARITPGADGRFAVPVDLPADQPWRATLTAEDDSGARAETAVAVTQDSQGPAVRLEGVTEGRSMRVDGDAFTLRGTATDPAGLDALRVEYALGGAVGIAPASPFSAPLSLYPGDNDLTVVALDGVGNERRVRFTLARDRVFTLRPPPAAGAATQLDLDRFALERLLTEADQRAIQLVEVPLRPALLGALQAIREPVTHGVDTSRWRAAEWNLYRLLNMTPDTADLRGTSLEALLQIANAIGLPSPRLVAHLLDSTVVTSCLDLATVTDVLLDQLVGTHPNAQRNARGEIVLRLSLYDIFQDLRPLAARFGPAGAHPGFLAAETTARALEPGFSLSIPVRSNLRPFEGVDLTTNTKRYLYLRDGTSVLDLDFTSDRFAVVGIVDQPTVDLGFSVGEGPAFARAGTAREAGADAAHPGFYRGNGAAWSVQPWLLERVVAESAYRQFRERYAATGYARTLRYDAGSIRDAAVMDWARGWVSIRTAGGLGSPPPPTYIWDVLGEIAQVRLHDGGVAEGAGNLAFTVPRVPIGITADELSRSLRPTLMAQREELSRRLVGGGALAASAVDVYFVPSSDPSAPGFLFFRTPADSEGPTYPRPGFFSDAALATSASTTAALPGTTDTTHQKVAATPGRVVYARDDGGAVFSLTVLRRTAEGLDVRVARVGDP